MIFVGNIILQTKSTIHSVTNLQMKIFFLSRAPDQIMKTIKEKVNMPEKLSSIDWPIKIGNDYYDYKYKIEPSRLKNPKKDA